MTVRNVRMKERLDAGTCLDVRKEGSQIGPGLFLLRRFVDDMDYCDAETEEWIWTIGRNLQTGEILACTAPPPAGLYLEDNYECLFLR